MQTRRGLLLRAPALGLLALPSAAFARDRIVNIRSHGAIGDGKTVNTRAIQKAIDACAAAGGGMIVVPAGVFVSGSIWLKPGVGLELRRGAVLRGSTDLADYPLVMRRSEEHTSELQSRA